MKRWKKLSVTLLTLLLVITLLNDVFTGISVHAYKNKKDNNAASDAQEKINEAEIAIQDAHQAIDEANNKGANTSNAEYLLQRAELEFEKACTAFENYDFQEAFQYASQAKFLANKAESSAEKASDGIDVTNAEKEIALESIAKAEEAILLANQTVNSALNIGVNITAYTTLLDQSITKFNDAVEALNNGVFEMAAKLAEQAEELARNVQEAAENAKNQHEQEASEQERSLTQEALNAAQESVFAANTTINNLRASGINVTSAEDLLAKADNTLHYALTMFGNENYNLAEGLAIEAKNLAQDAKALAETAEDEQNLPVHEKILETEYLIEDIAEDIENAPKDANLTQAVQLLEDADVTLQFAKDAFNDGNLTQAYQLAEDAEQDALEAEASMEEAIAEYEDEITSSVQEEIDDSEERLMELKERINELESEGFEIQVGVSILNVANTTLRLAQNALEDGFYDEAEEYAESVVQLVDNGLKTLDQLTESTKSELDTSEDAQGNTFITSNKGSLELSAITPSVQFNYPVNDTSLDFTVDFVSLIEFMDLNHDNEAQETEVLQTLSLESSLWDKTLQIQNTDGSQVINVIYTAESRSFDLALQMQVYEEPTMIQTSFDDTTVVFGIDGAAMETKITVIVNEWPWASHKSNLGLRMALDISAQGTVSEESAQQGNLAQLLFNASSALVKTEWLTKALLISDDGPESSVEVKSGFTVEEHPDGVTLNVFFVYPNFEGSRLEHDPNIGIDLLWLPLIFAPILSTGLLSIGSGAFATIVAVMILMFSRRRTPATNYESI